MIKSNISKLCSDIDNHFANICSDLSDDLLDIQNSYSEEIYIFAIKEMIVKIIQESREMLSNNKIKIVYITVLLNVLNQKHPLVVDIFVSVLVRKFYFLIPKSKKFPTGKIY